MPVVESSEVYPLSPAVTQYSTPCSPHFSFVTSPGLQPLSPVFILPPYAVGSGQPDVFIPFHSVPAPDVSYCSKFRIIFILCTVYAQLIMTLANLQLKQQMSRDFHRLLVFFLWWKFFKSNFNVFLVPFFFKSGK